MVKRNVVAVRLADEDLQKLDQLATLTFRGRADILRCLIHQADVAKHCDVIIGGVILPTTSAAEVVHVG